MRLEIETRRFYLGRDYSEAVEAFGGVPVHIPLIPQREMIDEIVSALDGILLPGSDSDVDPAYYGEAPHRELGRVVPEKDETEFMVLDAAERYGTPILAICYGMQALNVARGGRLVQDLGSQVENSIKHQQGLPLARNSHFVDVEPDSILDLQMPDDLRIEGVKVNSHHHQAISDVGENLTVIARASDGVAEAIQDVREKRFVLGVQWHPELSWMDDPMSAAIFSVFVTESAVFGETRQRKVVV